ncbi:hypothetical protein VCV18_011952 [Metarhizium anisopliae]
MEGARARSSQQSRTLQAVTTEYRYSVRNLEVKPSWQLYVPATAAGFAVAGQTHSRRCSVLDTMYSGVLRTSFIKHAIDNPESLARNPGDVFSPNCTAVDPNSDEMQAGGMELSRTCRLGQMLQSQYRVRIACSMLLSAPAAHLEAWCQFISNEVGFASTWSW